jgi:tellurite resistance protein
MLEFLQSLGQGARETQPNGKMSLFHSTTENAGPVTLNDKESVIALLFLVVTADGSIAPEEEELVVAASNRMKLLRGLAIPEFNAVVQNIRDAIDAKGRAEVFAAAVKGLPVDLSEPVYALAADIVCADGTVEPAEISFLREIQEAIGISDDLASKIMEVMRIKNRG